MALDFFAAVLERAWFRPAPDAERADETFGLVRFFRAAGLAMESQMWLRPAALLTTAGVADASRRFVESSREAVYVELSDEVINTIQASEPDDDQINRDDIIEQPRDDQDQNAGNKGNERPDMSGCEMHGGLRSD